MKEHFETISMPTTDEQVQVVVLADGEYPESGIAHAILLRAQRVVCCDGAAAEFISRGGLPYAIVGDGDSLSQEFQSKYVSILHLDPDQQTNDLTKAIQFCLSNDMTRITILGATGKREDHTIANISLLPDYTTYSAIDSVRIITSYGVFDPILCDTAFESHLGQRVSIFTISSQTKITTVKLKYPLHGATLDGWWQGSLNTSTSELFAIETDGKTVVFRCF